VFRINTAISKEIENGQKCQLLVSKTSDFTGAIEVITAHSVHDSLIAFNIANLKSYENTAYICLATGPQMLLSALGKKDCDGSVMDIKGEIYSVCKKTHNQLIYI